MKKLLLVLGFLFAATSYEAQAMSSSTKTAGMQNLFLGLLMNVLPEKTVSSTSALILFVALNAYQITEYRCNASGYINHDHNPFIAIPAYVVGKIIGKALLDAQEAYQIRQEKVSAHNNVSDALQHGQ